MALEVQETLEKLTDLGYFKYVQAGALQRAKDTLAVDLAAGWIQEGTPDGSVDFSRSLSWRQYDVDAENLCEGELGEYLMHFQEVLRLEGVELTSAVDEMRNDGNDYFVTVNGEEFLIYSEKFPAEDCWGMAYIRLMVILNTLLERAGSREHIYGLNLGNDTHALLLTPELFAYISSLPYPKESGRPYSVEELIAHYTFSWDPLLPHPHS